MLNDNDIKIGSFSDNILNHFSLNIKLNKKHKEIQAS